MSEGSVNHFLNRETYSGKNFFDVACFLREAFWPLTRSYLLLSLQNLWESLVSIA